MPVDVADWILAVLESTHSIIFCCWPAEIPGFVFYRAQQTLAPLGKRLKGRHQRSASRQALGGSRRLEALGPAPAPLGKRLECLGTAAAPLGKRLEAPSASWQALRGSRHRPSASRQALGDPNRPIRETRQQLFCSANVAVIYYPRLTTARLANAGRASA